MLLAPDTDDPIPVEVMRMVSAQLIEEPELIERLRTGQRDAACSCWKKSWIVCSQNTEIKHKRER